MHRNTRAVLIHQHYRGPEEPGILRPFRTANALAKLGFDSHVITARVKKTPGAPLWSTSLENGLHIHRANISYEQKMVEGRRILSYLFFSLVSIVKVVSLRPAVVYASSSPLLVSIPAFFAKLLWRSKIVFEVRDLWPAVPTALGYLKNPLFRTLALLLERFSYAISDTLVALSPGMATSMLETSRDKKPLHVLPNISDPSLFTRHGENEESILLDIDEDRTVLLYAGSFGETNDVSYLPHLCKEMLSIDPKILVVALGSGSHFKKTLTAAQKLGVLGANYLQIPKVPHVVLSQLVARASAYFSVFSANPALQDNSANKFFDGLAAGLPIIINYGGWQEQLLTEFDCGIRISNPIKREAVYELAQLMRDGERRLAMGSNAKRLAETHFSLSLFQEHLGRVMGFPNEKSDGGSSERGLKECDFPSCGLLNKPRHIG